MKSLLFLIIAFMTQALYGQSDWGIFSHNEDIGQPNKSGQLIYEAQTQSYYLKGGGYDVWNDRDECRYLYCPLTGDFILTAHFAFVGAGGHPHRKAGWMLRASTDEQAPHISAVLHGNGLTMLQRRMLRGAMMRNPEDEFAAPKRGYQILQLERKGSLVIMRAAHPGEPLQEIQQIRDPALPDTVLGGIFVTAHDPNAIEEIKVWNVRIEYPVPEDYAVYREGYKGSRLEILHVFSGMRKVIFEHSPGFEAPNWMPDGQHLLFNMGGSIYKISTEGGTYTKVNTGFAERNNNDHGISFDGQSLAISNNEEGGSRIYVLPLRGGTPRLITPKSPSYWHGWRPDKQAVIYVARRSEEGPFDLYEKALDGSPERQLTHNQPGEHADGCEYSPDGQHIYYNGNHTGTMQIWRMKPDGSEREQLTFDAYNDWFPHISPDGKWMVFLSYPADIDPNSHPFYQRVMLRKMPVSGGAPRVIAYLYGGQGTINVPSWSPDSQHLAFVSNSGE